jgi:hypothetical protein
MHEQRAFVDDPGIAALAAGARNGPLQSFPQEPERRRL